MAEIVGVWDSTRCICARTYVPKQGTSLVCDPLSAHHKRTKAASRKGLDLSILFSFCSPPPLLVNPSPALQRYETESMTLVGLAYQAGSCGGSKTLILNTGCLLSRATPMCSRAYEHTGICRSNCTSCTQKLSLDQRLLV